jgi:hypothetical protein
MARNRALSTRGEKPATNHMCYGNTQYTNPRNAVRIVLEYSLVELTSATDGWYLRASAQSQNAPIGFTISFHPSVCLSVCQSECSTSVKFVTGGF